MITDGSTRPTAKPRHRPAQAGCDTLKQAFDTSHHLGRVAVAVSAKRSAGWTIDRPDDAANIPTCDEIKAILLPRKGYKPAQNVPGSRYWSRCTGCAAGCTVRGCIVRSMTKRLSLILGGTDESVLEPFIRSGTGQHRVLQRWAAEHGVGNVNSEAAAIRALLQAGADALRDEVLDDGYAELAQVYDGTEEDERRAARDRYVARTEATA